MKTIGTDVSHYQGEHGAPIKAIVAAGAHFVIAKATGGTQVDPAWPANKRRIAAQAEVGGAYCFVYGSIDATAQADAFAKAVGKPDGLILAVDAEGADGPSGKDLRAIGTRLRSHFGPDIKLWLYSSYGYAAAIGNPDLGDVYDECWLAWYVSTGSPPLSSVDISAITAGRGIFGLGTPAIRQFGPTKAGGLTLDTNVYFGSIAELRALLATPKPLPPMTERLPYREAYAAVLDAATADIGLLTPSGDHYPAYAVGFADAKAAAADALAALKIAEPAP